MEDDDARWSSCDCEPHGTAYSDLSRYGGSSSTMCTPLQKDSEAFKLPAAVRTAADHATAYKSRSILLSYFSFFKQRSLNFDAYVVSS